MRPSDGLIGMWVHSFDGNGDVDRQFQILRRTGDGYLCQLYSLKDGYRSELKVISRKDIIAKMTIYCSHFDMNDAFDRLEAERLARKACETTYQRPPQPNREASLTLN